MMRSAAVAERQTSARVPAGECLSASANSAARITGTVASSATA
jgi:hypothetical protein